MLVAVLLVALLLYLGVLVGLVVVARRTSVRTVRILAVTQAVLCVPFVAGGLQRILATLSDQGLLSPALADVMATRVLPIVAAINLLAGGGVVYILLRVHGPIELSERLVEVTRERLPADADVSAYGLTPRELEVLSVLGEGAVSDREICAALEVAPTTVNTHVQSILRKTGLENRNDLVVLANLPER